jgi:predicted phosphodiesterase
MKLGLVTDIHEHVECLRVALDCFTRERVDKVVVIGDVAEVGERMDETCRLLAEAAAVGVWGNHDFGLCSNPDAAIRVRYKPSILDFMGSLRPRLEIDGCHFTHVEPWLNPEDVADLWYFDGPPDSQEKLDRIFGAVPNRLVFVGHFHQWLLASPRGIDRWQGETPVCLNPGRYFVVVGALCEGSYLVPFNEE